MAPRGGGRRASGCRTQAPKSRRGFLGPAHRRRHDSRPELSTSGSAAHRGADPERKLAVLGPEPGGRGGRRRLRRRLPVVDRMRRHRVRPVDERRYRLQRADHGAGLVRRLGSRPGRGAGRDGVRHLGLRARQLQRADPVQLDRFQLVLQRRAEHGDGEVDRRRQDLQRLQGDRAELPDDGSVRRTAARRPQRPRRRALRGAPDGFDVALRPAPRLRVLHLVERRRCHLAEPDRAGPPRGRDDRAGELVDQRLHRDRRRRNPLRHLGHPADFEH